MWGIIGAMPFDYTHLAREIRQARAELDLSQVELAERAGVSEKTIKNLEKGEFTRWPHSIDAVERALGKPEGWARAVARGQTPIERTSETAPTVPDAAPIPLRLALEDGRFLDYDVVTFDIGGEPVTFGAFVKSGVSLDEERREVLRKQLEAFGRIKGHIRREAEVADESDASSDDD
jgi:transcriptional regulator with XRE-family HTH domain